MTAAEISTAEPAAFSVKSLSRAQRLLWILILGMLTAFGPVCTDIYLPALPDLRPIPWSP